MPKTKKKIIIIDESNKVSKAAWEYLQREMLKDFFTENKVLKRFKNFKYGKN
ncbi:hypothetical protein LCGC14_0828710 [marine sediment metagenome]|uniref:Uncharacterized protein n=1 Tax=marine sediment metagenome TaxID=412755 RepID=A0A0F9Q1V2_9ZZZZ